MKKTPLPISQRYYAVRRSELEIGRRDFCFHATRVPEQEIDIGVFAIRIIEQPQRQMLALNHYFRDSNYI